MNASPETRALFALRRARQRRRLGDTEWFDLAYRVYLVALFGGGGVLWAASAIGNTSASGDAVRLVAEHGPAWLGLIAAVAVALGLRGGAQGGPLALEAADVTMVMLAPVDRRLALRRPATQRVRSAVGLATALGATAGQLAGRRLPGSPWAWTGSGAMFGATVGLAWAGAALCAHTFRLPRPAATAISTVLIGWQAVSAATTWPGPTTTAGSLAMWGWRQHPVDLIAIVVAAAATVIGVRRVGHTSLEALARRSSLVSQLRFAVTMQDLRTVVLLRRQLNQEHARRQPWVTVPNVRQPVVRRGLRGLARTPLTRLVRIAAIAAATGASLAVAVQGATAMLVVGALGGFLLGMETTEPLSQEIDQPNATDSYPITRGRLLAAHLVAPLTLLIPAAVVAGAAAFAVVGRGDALWPIVITAPPVLLAVCCGGVISVVRDAPDPFSSQTQQAFMPPEMAGFGTTIRLIWPIAVSLLGAAMVQFVRAAALASGSLTGAALRAAIGSVLLVGCTVLWVRHRDAMRARFRQFLSEGRNYDPNRPLHGRPQ